MKTGILHACLALSLSLLGQAQTSPFQGDFTVNGGVSINDQTNPPMLELRGAPIQPLLPGVIGASFTYLDSGWYFDDPVLASTIDRPLGTWLWQTPRLANGDPEWQMMLDSSNALSLFDPANPDNVLMLNPAGDAPGLSFRDATGEAARLSLDRDTGELIVDGNARFADHAEFAGTTDFSGSSTFTGDVHLQGPTFLSTNSLAFGFFSDLPSIAGLQLSYTDGGAGVMTFHGNRWGMGWTWEHDYFQALVTQMTLDNNNALRLYNSNTTTGAATVFLDPMGLSSLQHGAYLAGLRIRGNDPHSLYNGSNVLGLTVDDGFPITFNQHPYGGERMRVAGNGNIGIGTTAANCCLGDQAGHRQRDGALTRPN